MTLPEQKHTQGKAIFGSLTVLFAGFSLATDTQAQCNSFQCWSRNDWVQVITE